MLTLALYHTVYYHQITFEKEGKIMDYSEKTIKLIKRATKGRTHIKFTIGILHKGKETFKLFDSNGEIPYESYLYEIGSIGKTFTASLLAKYLEVGKMNLNDSIAKYLPELENNKYYPTLKRLVIHTAGYASEYPMTKGELFKLITKFIIGQPIEAEKYLHMDYEKMIRLIKERELQNRDYRWKYTNFGISLVGYAISIVAKKDFWDIMTEYLRTELGLENSFMGTNNPNILTGYDTKNRDVGNWSLGREDYLTPSGNITSNAEDLLKFAKMNIEESPNHLGLCHKRYVINSARIDMGLGWWIDDKNPNVFYHAGTMDGFATLLAFDKKKEAAVTVLANVNYYRGRTPLFLDILENL